jgi:hypothetical protein
MPDMGIFQYKGVTKPMTACRQVVEMPGSGKTAKLTAAFSISDGLLR